MLNLGERPPSFTNLLGTDGNRYSLGSFDSNPILVVIFSCNHCPYVQAYEGRLVGIQKDYAPRGVRLVAINPNDDKLYPQDSYDNMVRRARDKGFNFAYLRDPDQAVADAFGAVCTPHVFAFDSDRRLRYRGRIDDSKEEKRVTSPDLRNALDDLLSGREVRTPDTRPFGCSIKWIPA